MSNSKLKLIKILEILNDTDEENPVTASDIIEKLKSYDIYAERKSIYRDISILKESAGYDILRSDDSRLGYYMASRDFEDWEIKILMDAISSASFLTKDNSNKLIDKLSLLTSVNSRKILKTISYDVFKSENVTTKIYIDHILRAIKKGKKLSFNYKVNDTVTKEFERNKRIYIVNPYTLVWKKDRYYLICNNDKYDDLSSYRLDRIYNLIITTDTIKPALTFLGDNSELQISEYIRDSIYNYGGKKIKIELKIDYILLDEITNVFGEIINKVTADDKLFITVNALDGDGLYFWLLQWNKYVKVISPACVKERLILMINEILKQYEEDIVIVTDTFN